MDKESLEKIRVMLSEELQPIKNDIKELKKGQERLEISQERLEDRQKELENGQQRLENKQDKLQNSQERLEQGQEGLKVDVGELQRGQKEIKELIEDLDPKNASRHLELKNNIDQLRKDLSTVEIVTASNYSDIVRLKNIK